MKNHLYETKKTCPCIVKNIELTDDIKEFIMTNRLYHIVDEVKVTNQTINNYNTMNNFIANMDYVEKITKLANHKQLEIVDFESQVEEEYQRTVNKLDRNTFKYGFSLNHQNFMEIIDTLTKALRGDKRNEFIEHINFIYDSKRKRIRVYNSEKWEDLLVSAGLNYLISTIAAYYLESYETYLIRKINSAASIVQQTEQQKCLEDYYMFLACFDVDPYVKGKHDAQILYTQDSSEFNHTPTADDIDAHKLVDKFTGIYTRIDESLTNSQKRALHKEVLDTIKSNTKNTVTEIDKNILNLINIDEEFKTHIMNGVYDSEL